MNKFISAHQNVGQRSYQEDTYACIVAPEGLVLMVADGHGGPEASELIEKHFPGVWRKRFDSSKPMQEVFTEMYNDFDLLTKFVDAGSTLSIVFLPEGATTAYVAILGDSPVIIHQPDDTLWISPEHNVRTNQVEREAAEARGGIYERGYIWNDFSYSDHARGLQMSRALGDGHMGKIITREPECIEVPVGDWVLIGSDGLVDPGHDGGEESCSPEVMQELIDGGADAEELVQYAVDVPTHDNVTAILWRRG